jgi:hypothetical protein
MLLRWNISSEEPEDAKSSPSTQFAQSSGAAKGEPISEYLHSEERNPRQLVHWNEALWLHLIEEVQRMDDMRIRVGRWDKLSLSAYLFGEFTAEAVSPNLLRKRFQGLKNSIDNDRPIRSYKRGLTESVLTKMREYCTRQGSLKKAHKSCADHKKKGSSKNFVSAEANVYTKLGREFNSVVKMLNRQLLPTANCVLDSSLNRSKLFLSQTETDKRVLKQAIKFAFHEIRGKLVSELKEVTLSLGKEIIDKFTFD